MPDENTYDDFICIHSGPRYGKEHLAQANFPASVQVEELRQLRNVVGESVVRIIIHRAVARQRHVERTHFLIVGLGRR